MFGYVKAYKPQLRICEFELYKSVYCGLCKEMGRRFGLWSRFTLSYDFTFLALLDMSLRDDNPQIKPGRCTFNPLKRANCCLANDSLGFAADVAVLMLWHKLEDDRRDGGFWERLGARLLMLFASSGYRRAKSKRPELAQTLRDAMEQQNKLEREGCVNLDEICHPSAQMLGAVLAELSQEQNQKRVLHRLGYLLGRYVYLSDALDDLEKDEKHGDYNPLLLAQVNETCTEEPRERAAGALRLTIAETATAYELLELKRFGPVLENIIYLGLIKNVELIRLPKKDRPRNEG